jgi:type II secretory pathway pseudopilin PulG
MKRQANSAGFTIVETMVVLAVTGVLFATIALTLSSRQQSNEFTQAIQDVRSQIQQTIANVQSGYYTSKGSYNCTDTGSSLSITGGSNQLGTNEACVFLGDVIQFNSDNMVIYPIAGRRTADDLSSSSATPIVGADGTDESSTYALKYGVTPVKMIYSDGGNAVSSGAFGVLSPAGENSSGTGAANLAIAVYGLGGGTGISKLNDTPESANVANIIKSLLGSNPVMNPSGGVQICFQSGTTKEYGLMTIGQDNRQLNVHLDIMPTQGNTDCGI